MIHEDLFLIGLSRGASLLHQRNRYWAPRAASRHRLRRAIGRGLQGLARQVGAAGDRLARPALARIDADWCG